MAFVGILSQIKLLFGPLVIQLVWYILINNYSPQSRWKWWIFTEPRNGVVNTHHYSLSLRRIIVKYYAMYVSVTNYKGIYPVRYKYFVDFRHGISLFANCSCSCGIAVLRYWVRPPPKKVLLFNLNCCVLLTIIAGFPRATASLFLNDNRQTCLHDGKTLKVVLCTELPFMW